VKKINRYQMEQFAYFIGKLKSIPEGDGTLLDHVVVPHGSGLGDGNRHTHHDLPIILAGRGAGTFHTGGTCAIPRYSDGEPVPVDAGQHGARTDSLGDSKGDWNI